MKVLHRDYPTNLSEFEEIEIKDLVDFQIRFRVDYHAGELESLKSEHAELKQMFCRLLDNLFDDKILSSRKLSNVLDIEKGRIERIKKSIK